MKKIMEKIVSYFSDVTELPVGETLTDECSYISGRNEATFFGCRSILEYGNEHIRIRLFSYDVCISGENLAISVYSNKAVQINGCISKIEFGA